MASTGGPTELRVNGEAVSKLYQDYVSGSFIVNRRYQRKLVWSVEEKERLVDSIQKDLPIPLILLAEYVTETSSHYEIIDGLQRLNAVFSFIENRFSVDGSFFDLETMGDTKYLRDQGKLQQRTPVMPRETCIDIVNYQLPVSTYRSASHSAIDEVFRRINSAGRKLSLQEIRQAGVTSRLSRLVRRISSEIRGDATVSDVLPLSEMPKISITNKDLEYGINDGDIFWIKNGILDRDSVRESRDEELILDLLMDVILQPIATTGSEYRNAAYGRIGSGTATSEATIEARIQVLGEDRIHDNFFLAFDVIRGVVAESGSSWAQWTVTQQNPRGIPRYFHAIFIPIYELVVGEDQEVADIAELTKQFKGFWDKDLSVPAGGGVWGANRKRPLFDAVKSQLGPQFRPVEDKSKRQVSEVASQFEATLQMALTEASLFELKQGFCSLDAPYSFNETAFEKALRTSSAMANEGPGKVGRIFFGVADDQEDANRVKAEHELDPLLVGKFFVTGTAHELGILNRSIDEMLRWLVQRIINSKLNRAFATELATTLVPFEYRGKVVWSLQPSAMAQPVEWDNDFYRRVGNSTEKLEGQAILSLAKRFDNH